MARLLKINIDTYIAQFKHEGIRALLSAVITMGEYSAMSMIFTLGGLSALDSGYPKGGSYQLVQNMASTFQSMGGIIEYGKKVDCVEVAGTKANGVCVGETRYQADAVIVTSDTLVAIDRLFEAPLHDAWMERLRKEIKPVNCTFLSLGVKADMSHLPENMVLSCPQPFVYEGKSYPCIQLNNYAKFDGYAPQGCTAMTTMLFEDTYDKWKQACADGSYQTKKESLAQSIIQCLEQTLPQLKGKVEVWDVATPLTYERYCGTYRGSWMSIMAPNGNTQIYPCKCSSLNNVYFSGQRLMVPGGMPSALMTSRTAVQHLCKDADCVFQGQVDSFTK